MLAGEGSGATGAAARARQRQARPTSMTMQTTLDLRSPSHASDATPKRATHEYVEPPLEKSPMAKSPLTTPSRSKTTPLGHLTEPMESPNAAARRYQTPRSVEGVQPVVVPNGVPAPASTPRVIGAARAAKPTPLASDASDGEAFASVLQQAREEGLNIFAAAPTPTMRQSGRATGMIRSQKDWSRLNDTLPRDQFDRPDWNHSTFPQNLLRANDDERTNETVARTLRVVSDIVQKEDGYLPPPTPRTPRTPQRTGTPSRPGSRFSQPKTPASTMNSMRMRSSTTSGPHGCDGRPSLPTPGAATGRAGSALSNYELSSEPRNRFFTE